MDKLSELLGITTLDIIRWVVIAIIVVTALVTVGIIVVKKLNSLHRILAEKELKEKKREEIMKEHEEKLKQLAEVDKNVLQLLSELREGQASLMSRMDNAEKREVKSRMTELKDRAAQIYRYAHKEKQITQMQKLVLEEIIEEYEQYNMNSFIHSVILPEMPTWEVIEEMSECHD